MLASLTSTMVIKAILGGEVVGGGGGGGGASVY